jgi:peptidoglycan/LPS O-acetylase OafA/YrhL
VLGGFLITYLLLAEKQNFSNIKGGGFYIRRVQRMWPLFYLCVVFGFVLFPKLKMILGQALNETAQLPYYLSFLDNFDSIKMVCQMLLC